MFLYIDATTGGLLVQALLGGSAGLAVILRMFWGRLPFTRGRSTDAEGASVDGEPVDVSADHPAR